MIAMARYGAGVTGDGSEADGNGMSDFPWQKASFCHGGAGGLLD
jgi:hypothetical protein